jgi:protein-glucosylgalactosylhydroxylysine glucosidase
MFSAPLGVFAARLGDRRLAARLFEEGYAEFINKPWLDANEFSVVRHPDKPVVGPFYANLGGFLAACYLGLPGVEMGPDAPERWPRRPVVMPAGWDGIEVDRIFVRGRPARLEARHGAARARIEITPRGREALTG